jgi:subtilisin family serine protease
MSVTPPGVDDSPLWDASRAGGAAYVSPAWFADYSDADTPSHVDLSGLGDGSTADDSALSRIAANTYDWIVRFDTSRLTGLTSVAQTTSLLAGGGISFEAVRGLGLVGQVLVRSFDATLDSVRSWLANSVSVTSFEMDSTFQALARPNDTSYSELYGMENTGQLINGSYRGTPDADIDAEGAWDISTGSSNVVVGVIDTGVDYTHPDLAGNIWTNPREIAGNRIDDDGNGFVDDVHGYDFANNDGDPMDDAGHGTHVSGTIAGRGNNGQGVAGVNWNSSIMGLKFLTASGSGSTSDAVRAINYATMMRTNYGVNIRVTNNSWGGGGYSAEMENAIRAHNNAGILFVAAAGNESTNNDTTPHYPSNYNLPGVIAVAATDYNDQLASFSCYGATSVDLAAPGVKVYSTLPGNRYDWYNGTSMATPHVTGVAALAWAVNPNATITDMRTALLGGVDVISALNGKVATGGRLNALRTLQLIQGQTPPPPAETGISGIVWTDTDRDGVRDAGEQGRAGETVFLDLNNNGVRDAGTGAFPSQNVPVNIVDNATASSRLTVSGLSGAITDINVTFDITHTYDGDLTVSLVSPAGTRIQLFSRLGGSADNFTRTTLDDEASTAINQGTAPFTGTFRPMSPLSGFDGQGAAGTWTLEVVDNASADQGTLNSWSLQIAADEPSALTNSQGAYSFTGLQAGNYYTRVVVPSGLTLTAPAAGYYLVGLDAGEVFDAANFGLATGVTPPPAGTGLQGTIFNDANGNGSQDAGEGGLAGWTAFLDLNGNGLLDSGDGGATTVNSPNVPLSIADLGTITSTLQVSGLSSIRDLNVTLDITHTYDADLDVYLTSPSGTRVELFTDIGGSGDNFRGATLDDEASTAIGSGTAPFSGSFRPEGSLADFDGEDPNGVWTLTITDDAGADVGTLNSWSVTIATSQSEPSAVTGSDGSYSFLGLTPGTYFVAQVLQAGWSRTYPASGSHQVIVVSGQVVSDVDFGNRQVVEPPTGPGDAIGLYDPSGVFYLKNTLGNGAADEAFAFGPGNAGWLAISGDWDGDGRATIGLYDPATSTFYLKNSHGSGYADVAFGYGPAGLGWLPLAGDWDGDGVDTVGLYDPNTASFFLRNSHAAGNPDVLFVYGPGGFGWEPIIGDWDGDGVDTVGLYDPAMSVFYLRNSLSSGIAHEGFAYGPPAFGWQPVAGDWDGDGVDTVGLFAEEGSTFYLRDSHSGGAADHAFAYGPPGLGWTPLVGDWDAAVEEPPTPPPPTSGVQWTFMVYLDGDNNLEGAGIDDFLEMASVGSNDQINIVVQFDRIAGYDTTYGNWTDTRRGIIMPGDQPTASWGTSIGEANMGSQATLTGFVNWAVAQYPAERYALVLWDHGNGWQGSCWDDTDGSDYLEMRETSGALAAISPNMDLFGFDACLTGMIECAYEVYGEASVYVASEQTEPGDGWSYDTFLPHLAANPTWTAAQLGADIVVEYGISYGGAETLAAIDLSAVGGTGGVAAAVSSLASTIITSGTAADYSRLQTIYGGLPSYYDPTYRDLGTFLSTLAGDTGLTASIRTAAQTALTAYNRAIIRNHSSVSERATGMSIYLQDPGSAPDAGYAGALDFATATQWDEFLAWWQNGRSSSSVEGASAAAAKSAAGQTGLDAEAVDRIARELAAKSEDLDRPTDELVDGSLFGHERGIAELDALYAEL